MDRLLSDLYDVDLRGFRGRLIPLVELSKRYGVPLSALRTDFKWWCRASNLDPRDFYYSGYIHTGYYVPREFVEWWESHACRRDGNGQDTSP